MASRKTYFGIGWPKDPSETGTPGAGGGDAEDRSSPTVVDDEKVAEGLKQLRSWVQSDAPAAGSPDGTPRGRHPTPPPGKLGARPTAVGHATGPPPTVQPQRPIAPDPMRATMYGHDVHQFEFPAGAAEPTPTPQQPPPPASTALVVADPAVRLRHQAEAVPAAVAPTPSEAFQLARQGEAQRLHRPAGVRRSQPPAPSTWSRIPLASKLMFGFGLTALGAAIAFWVVSNNGSESSERPPAPAVPAPQLAAPTPPMPEQPPSPPANLLPAAPGQPIAPPAPRAAAPAATSTPTPAPRIGGAPLPGVAKSERPAPAVLKAPRRPREPKRELPTEVDEAVTTTARAPAERPSEQDLVQPLEIKDTPDPKAARETKETKEAKDTRDTREAREPKEPREVKETKAAREPKASKDSKSRGGEGDATLPPSVY